MHQLTELLEKLGLSEEQGILFRDKTNFWFQSKDVFNFEIIDKLNKIHTQIYSLDKFDADLQLLKEGFVKEDKQEQAKQLWIYQTIIEIHKLYINQFCRSILRSNN